MDEMAIEYELVYAIFIDIFKNKYKHGQIEAAKIMLTS